MTFNIKTSFSPLPPSRSVSLSLSLWKCRVSQLRLQPLYICIIPPFPYENYNNCNNYRIIPLCIVLPDWRKVFSFQSKCWYFHFFFLQERQRKNNSTIAKTNSYLCTHTHTSVAGSKETSPFLYSPSQRRKIANWQQSNLFECSLLLASVSIPFYF